MKYIIYISFLLFVGLKVSIAQTGIEADNLEVLKNFEAQLEEAKMIDVRPQLPKLIPIKKVYSYNVSIVPLELNYPAPEIKPLAMTETNSFDANNHFIRLGYGTVKDPNGLLRLAFHEGDRYKVNIHGAYKALDNTSNLAFQKMSSIGAGVGGFARLNENVVLNFDTDLDLDKRYFFDTRSENPNSRYGTDRTITGVNVKAGIANIDKANGGINYNLSTRFIFDKVAKDAVGTGVGLIATGEKRTSEYINIVFPIEAIGYATDLNENENEIALINFAPKIHFQKNRFMAKVGADVYYDNQLKSQLWPEVELAYGLAKNFIQIILGTQQKYKLNTLNHVMEYNAWASVKDFDLRTTVWKEYYGGVRGELNFLSYQFEGGYKDSKNALLVVNALTESGVNSDMTTLYDDIKAPFVRGNIDFAVAENMHVGGSLTQNVYTTKNEDKAWGMPSLEMNAYFDMKMFNEKLNVKSNLFISDKVYTRSFTNMNIETVALNNQIELDAEVAYWPIKAFGLFGYANNILNNKYQRWYGYPTVGINFGGGLQVKF